MGVERVPLVEMFSFVKFYKFYLHIPRHVSRQKCYTDSIALDFLDVVIRKVELVVTAREGLGLDNVNLVVDENESLRVTVHTLRIQLSDVTMFYPHSV